MLILTSVVFLDWLAGLLSDLFGWDLSSLLSSVTDVFTDFLGFFGDFPSLFLELVGFALVGIVVGIAIRLL